MEVSAEAFTEVESSLCPGSAGSTAARVENRGCDGGESKAVRRSAGTSCLEEEEAVERSPLGILSGPVLVSRDCGLSRPVSQELNWVA